MRWANLKQVLSTVFFFIIIIWEEPTLHRTTPFGRHWYG